MADCLVYWKVFPQQYQELGRAAMTPNWNTAYEYFPDLVKDGDNLWVVIRRVDLWYLIQRISIKDVFFDGVWRVEGDPCKSEVFDVRMRNQPDFTPILRQLNFASGKKITKIGGMIGTQIQRPRPLSDADVVLLSNYAKTLQKV